MGRELQPLATIFLRLIKSIVAPLLFGTLVYGIAGTGDIKAMGRIGIKAMVYFEVVTTVALFLGLGVVNLIQPGVGVTPSAAAKAGAPAAAAPGLTQILEHTFPASIVDAMAKNEVLQVVVFCFLFGAACAAIGEKARPVVQFAASLAEVMFKYTRYVMYVAPFGVAGAMAYTVSTNGAAVLFSLGKLVLTAFGAQALFVAGVLLPIADTDTHPGQTLLPCRAGTVRHRVLDRIERIGAAPRAREHGALRRPETYRGVCASDRIQLQPGRHDVIPVDGFGIHRASGGRTPAHSASS